MSDARHLPPVGDPFLAKVPMAAVALLIAANLVFVVIGERLYELTGFSEFAFSQLDLGSEYNFATWSSSMLLLLNAVLAAVLARRYMPTDGRLGIVYTALAIGFVVLSVDDFIMLHEYLEELSLEWFGDEDAELGFVFGSVGFILLGVVAEIALVQLECDYVGRCFRTEVVVEEGGELLAILCFATLQYRALLGHRAPT